MYEIPGGYKFFQLFTELYPFIFLFFIFLTLPLKKMPNASFPYCLNFELILFHASSQPSILLASSV